MVIVGVGAAAPGSEALLARTVTHCSPLEFSVDARKWQPGLFGAPRPVFTSVCVCALSAAELCFGLPDPATAMVSHLGSSRGTRGRPSREMERGWEEGALASSKAGPPPPVKL